MVSASRTSFPLQPNPVQLSYRPSEQIRLHVRVGLHSQPDIRITRQFLYR